MGRSMIIEVEGSISPETSIADAQRLAPQSSVGDPSLGGPSPQGDLDSAPGRSLERPRSPTQGRHLTLTIRYRTAMPGSLGLAIACGDLPLRS